MARAMAETGRPVWVAVSGPVVRVPEDFPCRVISLPAPRGRGWRWLGFDGRQWLGARLARHWLGHLLEKRKPAYLYERYSLYGTAGEYLAKHWHVPRVLEVNALLSEESSTRLHFPTRARAVERRVMSEAPALAAISAVMKSRLEAVIGPAPERIFVSPMGIDPRKFHPHAEPAATEGLFPALAGQARRFLVGYIGSFNHYHRPAWLLDLAEALRSREIPAGIVVIGGPAAKVERHRDRARRRGLEGRLRYLGEVDHDRLPGWLASFDLAVVPGASEQSSPTKIVEAGAVGVPQVMPDTPPIRHLAPGLGPQAFFPPGDLGAFTGRVVDSLRCLDDRLREARAEAPRFAAEHSWACRAREALDRLRALDQEGRFSPIGNGTFR